MLDALRIPLPEIFAVVAAVSFAAGLNIYATVLSLGLLARFGNVPLPPGLLPLKSWPVITVCAVLFSMEFFVDKAPAFDMVWNALHTFVRVPVAALLAYVGTRQLTPSEQLLTAGLAAIIALVAHGGKTAVRAVVTPSPEPISNISLSVGEDILAVSLTWLATRHPYAAGAIALCLLLVTVLLVRYTVRTTARLFRVRSRPESRRGY
jgi:hypothetical protein